MRLWLAALLALTAILLHHYSDQIFTTSNMNSNSNDQQGLESEEKKQNDAVGDDTDDVIQCKSIIKKFEAHSQKEGAGFIVNRPIGGRHMDSKSSDPFLMLDELGPIQYKKGQFEGAPWHPHRGFDTVMYMKHGEGAH